MSGRVSPGRRAWTALLLLAGCGHTGARAPVSDVLSVTELAARYALAHEVPAVLREGGPVCLTVEGRAADPEVLAHLSAGATQVSSSAPGCGGPLAVVVEVSAIRVSGAVATVRASVRLGEAALLEVRRVDGQWRLVRASGREDAGPSG
jgi:hypothetical protein